MIGNTANKILNLIKNDDGIEKSIILNPDLELQKLIDIILSECRCSIIDKNGNYTRMGSSTDIRIIKLLIQILMSNINEIPPEIVSIALTKEDVIGPFKKVKFKRVYDETNGTYNFEMEDIFPYEFNVSIFKSDVEFREKCLNMIIKPYVKSIIYDNPELMKKSPITSYFNKYVLRALFPDKEDDELISTLVQILNEAIKVENKELVENIANYIFINIMSNSFFKKELINKTIDATELQKLGRISIGFNSLVESMSYETLQMIELRNFPYGEMFSIKNTFYTIIAVLESLRINFEELNEVEILENIEKINRYFDVRNRNTKPSENKYRTQDVQSNKYGAADEFINIENISNAMQNLCKMIKVLVNKKDDIPKETYVKEVLRIHYRFLKIHPFESGNGRTARAIANILLQSKGLIGIFSKEKRKEYLEYIENANKIIKENENKYLSALSEKTLECIEMENRFLDLNKIPFLLVKS